MPAFKTTSPSYVEPQDEQHLQFLEAQSKVAPLLQERIARDSIADPFYWLTAGTCTKDEQPKPDLSPYRPFPRLRYLLYLCRFLLDFEIPQGYIYKSRTMMATWSASGAYTHYAATHPATKIVFQSQDEDRALHAVKNCKELWSNSVQRLREKWPLAKDLLQQPQDRLRFANGSEIVGIVGDPNKIKSEHPTIYCQDESAIIIEGEHALNEAVATRCPRITCISSAYPGWYADRRGRAKAVPYIQNPKTYYIGKMAPPDDEPGLIGNELVDKSFIMHGLQMLKIPEALGGFPVLDLDIEADPQFRDPAKMAALEKQFQPRAFFLREIKRQAYALSGATIYPEFDEAVHVVPHESIPKRGTLYMSLDPHPRTPHAALWIMVDAYSDWWVYREMWPSKIYGAPGSMSDEDEENFYTVKEYAQTIVELYEGNKIDWQGQETDDEYGAIRELTTGGEKICKRYMDQAGKGFQSHLSETRTEAYSTRYNRYGLFFNDPTKSHEAGEDAIHELLKVRTHDLRGRWPRLHISDRCPETILEMKNLRYKQMKSVTKDKDLHQTAVKARSHMIDNLRYLATSGACYEPGFVSERRG